MTEQAQITASLHYLEGIKIPEASYKKHNAQALAISALASGKIQVYSIYPWLHGRWAGKSRDCDYWLNSETALSRLRKQTSNSHMLVTFMTALSIHNLATKLTLFHRFFPTTETAFLSKHAQRLAQIERDKMQILKGETSVVKSSETECIQALKPRYKLNKRAVALSECYASDRPPSALLTDFIQKRIAQRKKELTQTASSIKPQVTSYLASSKEQLAAIKAPNTNHPLCVLLAFSGKQAYLKALQERLL